MTVNSRENLKSCQRLAIKIGSALITNDGRGLDLPALGRWAGEVAALLKERREVVLVSSGAVAAGMARLQLSSRPATLHGLQAAAAIGQMDLAQAWQHAFAAHRIGTAQVLLTHADLSSRQRYLNARNTLNTLLEMGVVPIINENDTVATDEIRFGDNDALAAMVANLLEAQLLLILTDQDGIFDADPRKNPQAQLIKTAQADDDYLRQVAGSGGSLGRGGMSSKVSAARLAAKSGAHTVIASGRVAGVVGAVLAGADIGSLLYAHHQPLGAKKQWLAQLKIAGSLTVDQGAARALLAHKSLLPIGVVAVTGDFERGDLVSLCDEQNRELARALVNYHSSECRQIMRHHSADLSAILGYGGDSEICHADNTVLLVS